ncbi:MAG TPA: multifunctional oxoglutarate decarboxylase/oxoglutarate dehydrogenase thiamine pyrophosphate-binding subunit/dihydrolipoyllysine-residue succinyltransferase subunit [Solirubrobacteraceae bacterium]|nr:multifunctional oxoglutarate decarboxylase/oxoglutarate dehydrogenase thiamine pyrophosphate-binding subunit/dihydrolipoyllysine-residue succinyltransferase subunit [Solirubrobacteraceae bacterium]
MVAGTTTQVVMPTMGDSVTEGTILEWHKAEGDHVTADETLVEISTDKVDAEVAAPVEGTVVKIHAAEGETVGVGALLAEIATNGDAPAPGDDAPAPAADTPAPAAETAAAETSAAANPSAGSAGTTIDIVTPAAGESVTEGTILDWTVAVGDTVAAGDTVVEISTDKVDVELPAPVGGTITELLAAPGETVTVGQVIGRMSSTGASTATANGAITPGSKASESPPAPEEPAPADDNGTKATPVARRTAQALGVQLGSLAGSGPAGRILKADVLAAADGAQAAPAKATALRGGAAMLAHYMDESLSIPTATSFRTIVVSALEGRRIQLKEAGARVSFTHLIAFAIARAGAELGVMANHYEEIDGKPQRIDDGAVNLGLAVDVAKKDGSRTLMVPVIRDAAALEFKQFLAAYDALVEKARTNTLSADDLVGANITLTNPGGIGTIASVPRLMPGQGTIVATGSIAYPVGLGEVGEQIGAQKVMTLTSTYDHRVIQGAQSGQFLARIDALLRGADGFYEDVFAALEVPLAALPPRTAPLQVVAASGPSTNEELLQAAATANALVRSLRTHGHLAAKLDPLGSPPQGDPALDPQSIGLPTVLMAQIPSKLLHMFVPGETLAESFPRLREVYCGTIAYQIEHIASHQQRRWLREKIEGGAFRQPLHPEEQRALLKRLIEVDALERFMHRTYLGQHQFSIEGVDMTVPMLDEMIRLSRGGGAREVVIGMAHRGRLNVLAHNLGRPYETIFAEFEGASTLEAVTTIPQGGTGDVKYHHGAQGNYELADGSSIQVNLESNPSHLEYVSPVVMGATRAAQHSWEGTRADLDTTSAVPIMIHGDAAFPGQGVLAETLNLQTLDGYTVGGSLHLITNNQTGFTTDPDDARSTHWASDMAKGFDIPIIHVNADDVEACISAVRLAFAYREKWGHDVLIDLIGYRRFGHNESDEPAYTQPQMYNLIAGKKRVWELWADDLISRKVVTPGEVDVTRDGAWGELTARHQRLQEQIAELRESGSPGPHTEEYHLDRSASPEVDTEVGEALLRDIDENLVRVPAGFTIHPKLLRQFDRRRGALDGAIDWSHAEALAYGSLLAEGSPIRLTGQDTERGTFSQRHLVLHDAINGQTVCPISQLPTSHAPFELHNSPLSEVGCMGFEYGYSQESPETLVLWEAQFGDFVNGAQVIVDQFIVSGLAKWGQTSRLTLLLPHGYEGSGPEHSSARLERFLALAAEGNLRVANPTTPAQYFHLLRRQAKIVKQRPLIVMTPKSLLRLPQATSSLAELTDGRFEPVLAERFGDDSKVTRLILCTGKIYYDLVGHPDRVGNDAIAVGRVELLYPFPENELLEIIARYPNLTEIAWVQEEPRNMGARAFMSPRLLQILPAELEYGYIGRAERASPGEGYPAAHALEQSRIVRTALDLSVALSQYPVKTPGER